MGTVTGLPGWPAGAADDSPLTRALLQPCLVAARRRAVHLAAAAGLCGGEALAEGLARHLVDRVGFAAAALAQHDLIGPAGAGGRGLAVRRTLLRDYPVLRRVLAAVWSGWSAFTADFTVRLARDLDGIRGCLLGDALAQPAWCAPGAGDIHQGGSVTIVGFSGGGRAVYRPRDSSHLVAWAAVTGILAAADPAVRIRAPRLLAGDGYAWAEFIGEEHPRSRAERAALCRRIGMTARLLEVLGACDMSESNVVVACDQVVLVDTETIIGPAMGSQVRPRGAAPAGGLAARDGGEPGPREPAFRVGAATGFLSLPMTVDARFALRNVALPARPDYAFVAANAPLVLDGYAAMHRALVGHLRREAGPASLLRSFERVRARFLARSTQVYWILLHTALEPAGLRDEQEFERRLGRLRRAAEVAPEGVRAAVGRLADAEVSALGALDIPYFEITATSCDVLLPGTGSLPAYARLSPCARAASRLMALGATPAPEELDTVRALLAAAAPAGIVGVPPSQAAAAGAAGGRPRRVAAAGAGGYGGPGRSAGTARHRPPDWARRAAEVAAVLTERAGADDGALAFRPRNSVVVLERLGPDLLSGYAGLAVVLADAAALLQDHALAGHARALAARTEEALRVALAGLRADRPREVLDAGAYCGIGALVYALARVEASLGPGGSPWRDEVAAALGDCEAIEAAARRHGWDLSIATGTAGLVLALRAAGLSPGLARWWPGFVARTLRPESVPLAGTHPLAACFLPSQATGVRFVAAVLGTTVAADLQRPGAVQPGRAARPADWFLSRAATADTGGLLAAARAMATAPDSWTALAALGEVEAGLAARGAAARAGALLADRAGRLIVQRFAQAGAWFPEAEAPDRYRLSALWGLGAVCHAFVRLAVPSPVPSIRLIPPCGPALAQPRPHQHWSAGRR